MYKTIEERTKTLEKKQSEKDAITREANNVNNIKEFQ
jgi:hypothetical protein